MRARGPPMTAAYAVLLYAAAAVLVAGGTTLPPRPDVEAEPALAEIGRQCDLAAHALGRLRDVGVGL